MKTIGEHISNIRMLIRQYGRTPEGYTDEGLYSLFSVCRATILKQQFQKLNYIPDDNWLSFCMSLEKDKWHNCNCVPDSLNCIVLKSKYPIPPVISGVNTSKIRISTLGGKQINLLSEDDWRRKKERNPSDYYGSIINSYLILWNVPLTLRVVNITGVLADPLDLQDVPNCDEDGNTNGLCFDPLITDYPLQEEFVKPAYDLVLQLLGISLQIKQDTTNNSNGIQ